MGGNYSVGCTYTWDHIIMPFVSHILATTGNNRQPPTMIDRPTQISLNSQKPTPTNNDRHRLTTLQIDWQRLATTDNNKQRPTTIDIY